MKSAKSSLEKVSFHSVTFGCFSKAALPSFSNTSRSMLPAASMMPILAAVGANALTIASVFAPIPASPKKRSHLSNGDESFGAIFGSQ